MWTEVPADRQNGIITGYTITYKSQAENDNGNVQAGPDERQKELANLKEYVNYNITVFASTVKGAGPPSDPVIVVRTDQDSKYFILTAWYVQLNNRQLNIVEHNSHKTDKPALEMLDL